MKLFCLCCIAGWPIPCGCYSLWVVPGWLRKRPGWLRERPGWLRKRPLRIVSGFASFAAWHRLLQIWEMVIQRGWSPTFARTSGWAEKRHAEGLVADLRSHLCMACGLRPIPCGCYSLWVVPGWLRKRPGWLRKRPLRIVSGFASFAAWHRLPGWLRERPGWLRERPGWLRERPGGRGGGAPHPS